MAFLFAVFIALLPFLPALNALPRSDIALSRVIIVIFSGWVIYSLIRLSGNERRNAVSIFVQSPAVKYIVMFLAIAGTSFFVAENHEFWLRKFIFLINIAPIYFIALYFLHRGKDQRSRFSDALLAGGACIALVGAAQFLAQFVFGDDAVVRAWKEFVVPIFSGYAFGGIIAEHNSWYVVYGERSVLRALATFPDAHSFGVFLGTILPFAFAKAFTGDANSRLGSRHVVSVLAFLSICFALLFTFSRGAYLGVIVLGIFVSYMLFRSTAPARRISLMRILAIAALALLILPWNPVGERFWSIFDLHEGSNVERLRIWAEAGALFREHLLFGVGIGNYAYAVDPSAGYRSSINAHNLYFELAVETGMFGLGAFLMLLLGPTLRFLRSHPMDMDSVAFPATGAVIFFAAASLVETTIWNPTNFALLMIMLAWASPPSTAEEMSDERRA